MTGSDMGMNIDQVMVIERPGIADTSETVFNSAIETFRNELKKDPTVHNTTLSFTIPGKQREYKVIVKKYGDNTDSATMRYNSMDYDFLDVFKMKLVAGRNFSKEFPNDDDTSVIISEKAAQQLGYKKPQDVVGKTIVIPQFGWSPIIVGVINDYNQVSLKKPLDPTIISCSLYNGEYYSLRLNTNDLSKTLASVQRSWTAAFPGIPLSISF